MTDSPRAPTLGVRRLEDTHTTAKLSTLLALLRAFAGPGSDETNGLAAKEWNQPRGNAAGTAALEVAPLESEPVLLWTVSLESVVGAPVTWAGVLYTVDGDGRKRTLRAWSIEDGTPQGSASLLDEGETWLAAWNGMVAVVTAKQTSLYQHKASRLRREKGVPISARFPPAVYGGWLFLNDGARLFGVEMRTGAQLELVACGPYRPALVPGSAAGQALLASARHRTREGYEGQLLALETHTLDGLSGKKLTALGEILVYGSTLGHDAPLPGPSGYVAALGSHWFVYSAQALQTTSEPCHASLVPLGRMVPIVGEATCRAGRVFGFSAAQELLFVNADGAFGKVVPEGVALPTGAVPGAASMARQVLYLGNWAVDTEDGRVLWCLPDLAAVTPAIPVADGRVAFVTRGKQLVCYGNSASTAVASDTHRAAAGPRPTAPGSGPGLVLEDGRRVSGAVTLAGERLSVASTPALEVARGEVALLETADGVQLLGEEHPVLLAWWDVLRLAQLDVLEQVFESYRTGGHLADCQRVLEEAVAFEAEPERLDAWSRSLTGKAASTKANAPQQRARIAREEEEQRLAVAGEFVAAAEWCREHGLGAAATVLLARSERVSPGGADRSELARALVPAAFPWKDAPDAARRWMRFAEELLPAGAAFVDPRAELELRKRTGAADSWGRAWALRTRNLVLFTREEDPAVLGGCLRNGEGVLRVLERVFAQRISAAAPAEDQRLEVRLHRDRAAYLGDGTDAGTSLEWSSGHYRPAERLSSFYVPRDAAGEPRVRELNEVLVHELTHQFLAERWSAGKSQARAAQPGFWMIEGVATFFEGQVVDLGRRRRGIDDPRARAIDASAQLAARGQLFPLARFLVMPQTAFAELGDEVLGSVRLRHALGELPLSERGAFYCQAGSLFFHLFHSRGAAGREALLALLAEADQNRYPSEPWKALGIASVEELERGYHEFLAGSVR